MREIRRVAVVGVGLIGGSVALAARERAGATVVGWDPDPAALDAAVARGALDAAAPTLEAAVAGDETRIDPPTAGVPVSRGAAADLVVVAAPVRRLPEAIAAALDAASPGATVTDVGSTKRLVTAASDDRRFIGGHPLAGAETAGVEHARADLFDGATWYLTPTARTEGLAYERLQRFVSRLGARPQALDAETHDRVLAAVSHLPHVLANVLVAQAARALDDESETLPAVGPSFRDATRVAGAPTAIWGDIYRANADALAALLDDTIARLAQVRDDLRADDADAIVAWNDAAGEDRRRLLAAPGGGNGAIELRVTVPNQPGVVAEIALALGRTGVNIADMALYPAPDNATGVVALWVAEEAEAVRTRDVLAGLGHAVARGVDAGRRVDAEPAA